MANGLAVCVAGEPRSFTLPCVHRSLRERVIVPLTRAHTASVLLLFKESSRERNGTQSGVLWVQGRPPSADVVELNRVSGEARAYSNAVPERAALERAAAYVCKPEARHALEHCIVRSLPLPPSPTSGRDLCGRSVPCKFHGAPSPSIEALLAQQATWQACLKGVEELER